MLITGRRSKSRGRAPNTAKLLKASKSTWTSGQDAEELVLKSFLKRGYDLHRQRYRTPFGEIDLWLSRLTPAGASEQLLIEVKTLSHDDHLALRVGRPQKRRLQNILLWFCEQVTLVRLIIVYVRPGGTFISLALEDL